VASFSEAPRHTTSKRHAPRLRAEVVTALAVIGYIVSIAIGVAR